MHRAKRVDGVYEVRIRGGHGVTECTLYARGFDDAAQRVSKLAGCPLGSVESVKRIHDLEV